MMTHKYDILFVNGSQHTCANHTYAWCNYVEAEEAVASSLFSALMNINCGWTQGGRVFVLGFNQSCFSPRALPTGLPGSGRFIASGAVCACARM